MARSSKFLEDVSESAVESGGFSGIKKYLGMGKSKKDKEKEKEEERKKLIEKERQRTLDELKNE